MTRDRLPKCSRFSAFEGWGQRWVARSLGRCSRSRRHSAHIRWLMTPPPCVINRSAFIGSRPPVTGRQLRRTRRQASCCVCARRRVSPFFFFKQESRRSSIYLRSAAIAGQRLQALWCAPVRSLPRTGLRSVLNVPCSSFSAETAGGFLVSRWPLAATSRTSPRLSRRRIRVEHPFADLLRWSGADEARLFARAIVFGIGTSCTPAPSRRLCQQRRPAVVPGLGCAAQWWSARLPT